jgi:hypothetical protein
VLLQADGEFPEDAGGKLIPGECVVGLSGSPAVNIGEELNERLCQVAEHLDRNYV